jgi:hypothetical protein
MKQGKLKLDTLRVESFETGAAWNAARGTIRAHQPENTFATETDASDAMMCPTHGNNVCSAPTAGGCVEYTGECSYDPTGPC